MAGLETYPELPDSRSIRVIKLYGATSLSHDIRFDLITVSLDSPLPFEAISYTWSGQALDRPVYANGKEYLVTRNAEDVMRRLRPTKPERSRNLWIDAICINQKDDEEKAAQAEFGNEILDVLCKTKATVAKDKLFAIRGMFPDSLGALTVDYSASDSDVYTEAARIVLEETQNIEFFRYACQSGRADGFPTWVPPWTALIDIPEWLCNFAPAAISQKAVVVEAADAKVLKLKGRRVDRVTPAISERFPTVAPLQVPMSRSLDLNLASEALLVFRKWVGTAGAANNQDPCLQQLAWLISETIKLDAGDVLDWFQLIWSEDNFGMETLWDYGLNGGQLCDSRKITVNFLQLVSGRSLFVTESGRVGISTLVVRPEDQVALLTGEKLPYIIRKGPDHLDNYMLVAPCWLSGALMGEEWPGWNGELEALEDIALV
ncbi:hypothetical protein TrVFT333_006214 [Trichoderma virens FT-333]|nr:hypothetical protein TrVFT333_006214 [Trichoderma virens FT-333]